MQLIPHGEEALSRQRTCAVRRAVSNHEEMYGSVLRDAAKMPLRRMRKKSREISASGSRPAFAAAERADAAFDFQCARTRHRNVAGIGFSVIGVVDLAGPFVRTNRSHAAEQRKPDHRTFCQVRIRVLVIDLSFAGCGIDGILQPHHDSANSSAAFADADFRVARLCQPDTAYFTASL